VTAGHCVSDTKECESYAYVFDYAYRSEGELEDISASDVYGCRRLVARKFTNNELDYAIIQLDRVPSGRVPAKIRRKPVDTGEAMTALGFTSGLPLKVDSGAHVKNARADSFDYFALTSDTFEGSSGSGIFDSDRALAGVLVRGGEDYLETDAGCFEPRVVPADAGTPDWRWEQATYVEQAIRDLCDQGYPSEALCDIAPRCGDGFCSFAAVDADCAEDCAEGACSDTGCTKGADTVGAPGDPIAKSSEGANGGCSVRSGAAANRAGWLMYAVALLGVGLGSRRRRCAR
jgi:hypothetical protein